MATVAVFTIAPRGHIHPTLPIVAELVRRGDRVVYYCAAQRRPLIEGAGAEFRPIPWNFDSVAALSKPHFCDIALDSLRLCESWMPGLIAELKELAPSYVLVDFLCPWGRYAARALGLPVALLVSSFVPAREIMPPVGVLTALDVGLSPRRLRTLFEVLGTSKRLASRYGVERMRTPFQLLSTDGDIILSTSPSLFQPRRELLGEHVHFVGPTLEERSEAQPWPLPTFDERPLVYVSLGTIFNGSPTLFQRCVEALSDGKYQVLMSIGPHVDKSTLGPLSPHIHILNFLPQLEALRRAAVFVSHGGMNSLCESIHNEVPLLLAPQGVDQFRNSDRCQELGVGRRIRPWPPSAAWLREAIDELVTDPKYRERCREVRDSMIADGGARRAADLLAEFSARRPQAATG